MRKRLRKKKIKQIVVVVNNDILSDMKWKSVQDGQSLRYDNTKPLPVCTFIKGTNCGPTYI